jgi:hypothetical protein
VTDVLAGTTTAFQQEYFFDLVGNRVRKETSGTGGFQPPAAISPGTTTSVYNARDQLLRR